MYGKSHTIVFDPKTLAKVGQSEYYSILNPYRENTMLKFSLGAEWLFGEWRGAGWYTWGYLYAREKTEKWWTRAINSQLYDVISMEYSASQGLWDELKATGHVLTSHISYRKSEYEEGRAKGAKGSMVASIADVCSLKV